MPSVPCLYPAVYGTLPPTAARKARERHYDFQHCRPGSGILTTMVGSCVAIYRVTEHTHVPYPSRAFRLAKVAGGSDPECRSYDIELNGDHGHSCECRG